MVLGTRVGQLNQPQRHHEEWLAILGLTSSIPVDHHHPQQQEQPQKRQCSQEKRPLVSRGLAWLLHGHYLHVSRNVLIFIERPLAGFAPPSDYHELRLYYYYYYFVYYGIETLVNILVRGSTQQICIYVWYTGFATEGKQAGREEGPPPSTTRLGLTWSTRYGDATAPPPQMIRTTRSHIVYVSVSKIKWY